MILNGNLERFGGMEFAVFRLKQGVSEEQLIEMSKEVEKGFLREQEDLISHFLLRGKDGIYADVAIATTQQKAEEYCQQWLTDPLALAYLDLIEPDSVSMTFWAKVN